MIYLAQFCSEELRWLLKVLLCLAGAVRLPVSMLRSVMEKPNVLAQTWKALPFRGVFELRSFFSRQPNICYLGSRGYGSWAQCCLSLFA